MSANLNETSGVVENGFLPASITDRVDLSKLFGRLAPVEIDLGCGDGTFLTLWAAENPDRNFLGIERSRSRLERTQRKITVSGLDNIRLLGVETSYAVSHLIPPGSVSAVHLLFPDPWPKRRHRRRRVFTHGFLGAVFQALGENGLFHIATDDPAYLGVIERVLTAQPLFVPCENAVRFPPTRFEERFVAQGTPIYRLLLRKVSPVR